MRSFFGAITITLISMLVGILISMATIAVIVLAGTAHAEPSTPAPTPTLYPVVERGDLKIQWFDDGAAQCYVATDETGATYVNNGVARSVALNCRWK